MFQFSYSQTTHIHVDQFGYQTGASKVAVLANPQIGFNSSLSYVPSATIEVRDFSNDQVVFTGAPSEYDSLNVDDVSGDAGWWFDFSSVTTQGTFYIHDVGNNLSSHPFEIEDEPYREILRAATKTFYLNRCNFTKEEPYIDSSWADGMNFSNPLQDANCRLFTDQANASLERNLSGGWFDGGVYNKSVSNAFYSVHTLLTAYQKSTALYTDNWNIPESGNGVPDLLDELKWELDWLFKMTNVDGSVQNKVGHQNYGDNTDSPPSANTDQRFYGPTCSSSTIGAASIFAHAAVVFNDIPTMQTYAAQLQAKAELCYTTGVAFFNNNNFQTDCDTVGIASGGTDWSIERQLQGLISAAIYLHKATGDPTYELFLINNGFLVSPLQDNYWSAYSLPMCDALIYYASLTSGVNTGMQGSIISSANSGLTDNWSGYFGMTPEVGLYRDYMPSWAYGSGSNYGKAGYGCLNIAIADLGAGNTVSLREKAESMLHTFHGVNPIGTVYLSNMYDFGAENPVNEIYHYWFADGTDYDHALNSLKGPPPGYVVGGPNKNYSVTTMVPPYGQPFSKSYLDFNDGWPNNAWQISEPEIPIQAFYIRLLSDIIGSEFANLETTKLETQELKLYPNPANDKIFIIGNDEFISYEIFNLSGKRLLNSSNSKPKTGIDISSLSKGLYIVKIETSEGWATSRFEKI